MNVVLTDEATADLILIGRFIGRDNPRGAASFVDEIEERCNRLADMPRGYPLVPRYEHSGVRRRVHGNYLIFYRVGDSTIEVLRVLHGARDYEAILFRQRD